jgi:hypothetical protein
LLDIVAHRDLLTPWGIKNLPGQKNSPAGYGRGI